MFSTFLFFFFFLYFSLLRKAEYGDSNEHTTRQVSLHMGHRLGLSWPGYKISSEVRALVLLVM